MRQVIGPMCDLSLAAPGIARQLGCCASNTCGLCLVCMKCVAHNSEQAKHVKNSCKGTVGNKPEIFLEVLIVSLLLCRVGRGRLHAAPEASLHQQVAQCC